MRYASAVCSNTAHVGECVVGRGGRDLNLHSRARRHCGASDTPYDSRRAASAASASSRRNAKNAGDWPRNNPSSVSAITAPIAAPMVAVGLMIDTTGNIRFRKTVDSGMIRLVWKSSPPNGGGLRVGKSKPLGGGG